MQYIHRIYCNTAIIVVYLHHQTFNDTKKRRKFE